MHGAKPQRQKLRWVETWIIDPLCGAPIKRLTHGPRLLFCRRLLCCQSSIDVIDVCLANDTLNNRHTPVSKNKHFALPTQDTPFDTARSAMRLGFGCLTFLRHQKAGVAGRSIRHPPIRQFSVGGTFRPIIAGLYLRVCVSLLTRYTLFSLSLE
jgi:hypothetical protein